MIRYLGLEFNVVDEDETSVVIRRADATADDHDITIMKDSQRYETIFKTPKVTLTSLVAQARDANEPPANRFLDFIDRYAIDTTSYTSSPEALDALEQEVTQDSTGLFKFILATFAYKNTTRFKAKGSIDILEDMSKDDNSPVHYTSRLFEFYMDSIENTHPLDDADFTALNTILPQEFRSESINAICGFNFGDRADWVISFKQAQSLLTKLGM